MPPLALRNEVKVPISLKDHSHILQAGQFDHRNELVVGISIDYVIITHNKYI